MMEKISNLFEDFLILVTQVAFWVYVVVLALLFMVGIAGSLAAQAIEWLQVGMASPRDGFWLYALSDCGSGSCRPDVLNATEWVGVNRIINWMLDLHVAIYAIVLGWFGYGLAIAWAESIGNWKAREARFRKPPPRPTQDD